MVVILCAPCAFCEDLPATVIKVLDGDTIKVSLYGPMPELFRTQSVRLRGCDTPEKNDKRPEVAALARMATDFTTSRFSPGDSIMLYDVDNDKYGGRILAHVFVGGQDLCDSLMSHDPPLAKPYQGGHKEW
jgi:endonuclease YncB( thermonuclease family)